MKNVIYTPFGNFGVKQNEQPVEFNYTIKNYSSNKSSALIRLYVIEIDAKEKEALICGFDEPIFENLNKDEHSTTLFVENETLVLGLCNINPNKQSYIMTTNNAYGFTYKENNKITLILCCIEKEKFKDAKKIIQKAIQNEMEMLLDIKIKKKSKRPLLGTFLFILLSFIYIAFALLLTKYKIVSHEMLKKIGIGMVGVVLISFALTNLSVPKKPKKMKKNKTTFLVSLLLLTIILVALGITAFMFLNAIGTVKNEMILGIGLIIISLVILCWFTSEYKLEKPALDKKRNEKVAVEISSTLEQSKSLNPHVLNLALMFPKHLKEEWISLINKLQIEKVTTSEITTIYQLTREMVTIPYRIELQEFDTTTLTEHEKRMLYCVYTRHKDGYIREKYIKKILETELQEWEFPFILKLSEEYVYEILASIYNNLIGKDNRQLMEFAKNNKELLCKGYSKMLGYWNRFYRARNLGFHNYIGRKLFYECFGYRRKYEKKRYRCACCNNRTIEGYLIHYYNEPCPVCHWQNNSAQNNNPEIDGINKISLKKAQQNYQNIGAIKEEYLSIVRKPTDKEKVKLDLDRIIKLLKVTLIKEGFKKNKDHIYEYRKNYFKVDYQEEKIFVEKAKSQEEAMKNVWETLDQLEVDLDYKSLVEKMVTIMKKSCEKKKTKKLTKIEKDEIVGEEIRNWDPLGFIENKKPNGEYQIEIKKITTKLSKLKTEEEFKEHIEQVFQKLFGESEFTDKENEIKKVAKKIWARINQKV